MKTTQNRIVYGRALYDTARVGNVRSKVEDIRNGEKAAIVKRLKTMKITLAPVGKKEAPK